MVYFYNVYTGIKCIRNKIMYYLFSYNMLRHFINVFYSNFKLLMILMCTCLPASNADSSEVLFSLITKQDVVQRGSDQDGVSIGRIYFDDDMPAKLNAGTVITVPVPGGGVVKGKVVLLNELQTRKKSQPQSQHKIISLDNNAGSVELRLFNDSVTQMVFHDVVGEKIYRADINADGYGELRIQNYNDSFCVDYPRVVTSPVLGYDTPPVAAQFPDITTLGNLQSRPDSENVLFIDFWGGTLSNSYWNVNYTGNAPIHYTAFDIDANPGSFSSNERYRMWLAWREVVEDFAPFNINITTSRVIYDAAAVTNRVRMIVTGTSQWYGSSGGVALVDVFNDTSDYSKVAWTWNLGTDSMGMTISHEAGHQLGLLHDGTRTQSYYRGHGNWGPVMGASFGKSYVQWSKGEYPDANQDQDDIEKISRELGYIPDDAGNNFSDAQLLSLPVKKRTGLIGFGDTDSYRFNLSSPEQVHIKVIPLLGDENESHAANLAMDVSLVKLNAYGAVNYYAGKIYSSDIVPLTPLTNKFEYTGNLGQGTYALRITPNSPDKNWTTGFGNYGVAGEYRLSISATNQFVRTLGRPEIDRSSDVGLYLWENAKNKWAANVVSGDKPRNVDIRVISDRAISNVVPISIESNDEITHTADSLKLKFNVKSPWVDGVKFTISDHSHSCISVANSDLPLYLGPDRVRIPASIDLSSQGACHPTNIKTLGRPELSRSTDVGIYAWENARGWWQVEAVSAGIPRVMEIDVSSEKTITNIKQVSIEFNDVFAIMPDGIDLRLNVSPPWMDGLKFTEMRNSNTCISTTSTDVPIKIGPDRINMGNNVNLTTLTSCSE